MHKTMAERIHEHDHICGQRQGDNADIVSVYICPNTYVHASGWMCCFLDCFSVVVVVVMVTAMVAMVVVVVILIVVGNSSTPMIPMY